ncbi:transcription antitermination factor NusB [bacterium]|nr:transcription antitermination factor NusB [bacterium]
MASRRRKAREIALEVLYQIDLVKADPDEALELALSKENLQPSIEAFTRDLVKKTVANQTFIDENIVKFADNWALNRMATLDRCILRFAITELLNFPDIPVNVTINEAVEIARKYSTERSSEFVNGILDKAHRELMPGNKDAGLNDNSKEKPSNSEA